MKRILTGIKPTGMPHLGNYLAVIKPSLSDRYLGNNHYYFIADYHALTTIKKGKELKRFTHEVAATWLACGLDPEKVCLYKQSDIPEIFQLAWMLSCYTPKGLLNRAHAYKSKVDENEESIPKRDPDHGIDAGLFNYPVLMAADIILFKANVVPIGKDQCQHIEIARDIAQRFNHHHNKALVLPAGMLDPNIDVIQGLDGRKMSKSYDNTIPLCCPEKKLHKLIKGITTDSADRYAPKDPDSSTIYHYYKNFTSTGEQEKMHKALREGMAWGDAKEELFQVMNKELTPIREQYDFYMGNTQKIDEILGRGRERAGNEAKKNMLEIKERM